MSGRRKQFSTATVDGDGGIVPWLAADGPLAYTPEAPPDRDYFFQYGWVLPDVLNTERNSRRHYYFGAPYRDHADQLFAFWESARSGGVDCVAHVNGVVSGESVTAPVAVYCIALRHGDPGYLFIQHGSYQWLNIEEQPLLEAGQVILYRGVQKSNTFRQFRVDLARRDPGDRQTWQRYVKTQAQILSGAVLSFNSIHDRAKRCETGHINDRSWMSDDLARTNGLDIDAPSFAHDLWNATHESCSLAQWVGERKFGPSYVKLKTPLDNIRLTTFFAGEHEVRVIDPDRVELIETHGCEAVE